MDSQNKFGRMEMIVVFVVFIACCILSFVPNIQEVIDVAFTSVP